MPSPRLADEVRYSIMPILIGDGFHSSRARQGHCPHLVEVKPTRAAWWRSPRGAEVGRRRTVGLCALQSGTRRRGDPSVLFHQVAIGHPRNVIADRAMQASASIRFVAASPKKVRLEYVGFEDAS